MKVIMSIFTENMQPHYDNKKIQNYIIKYKISDLIEEKNTNLFVNIYLKKYNY